MSLTRHSIAACSTARPSAVLAAGVVAALIAVAAATALSWLDSRWVLIALSAACILLPCALLAARGKLDIFEPLTWFAVIFLVLWVARPAWDLGHENFVYQHRVITHTFTRMLVAGLLAGGGFVLGYHLPAGRSLAARLPRPPEIDPRRVLTWAGAVLAAVVVAFGLFFTHAHGWHHPGSFFFRSRVWLDELAATPAAASKYFIVSVVLAIPAAILLLVVRAGADPDGRVRRIAHRAALASIAIFLLYNLAGGQRHYVGEMLGAIVLFYYLRRGRRPSARSVLVMAVVGLTLAVALLDLRGVPDLNGNVTAGRWLPWNAPAYLLNGQDTGMAPALAAEMLVVPSHLHYTDGKTTVLGPFETLVPRQLWPGKPMPADQQVLASVWNGRPCGFRGECDTFSPFGEPYRDGGLVAVFIFAVLFGVFWRTAWAAYSRYRANSLVVAAYACLLPFMVTWMRGDFTLAALEVTAVLTVVLGAWLVSLPGKRRAISC